MLAASLVLVIGFLSAVNVDARPSRADRGHGTWNDPASIGSSVSSQHRKLAERATATYSKIGCWQDAAERTLTGPNTYLATMTPASCAQYCSDQGYKYAGAEASNQVSDFIVRLTLHLLTACCSAIAGTPTIPLGPSLQAIAPMLVQETLLRSVEGTGL
jgi:hypothetical protein